MDRLPKDFGRRQARIKEHRVRARRHISIKYTKIGIGDHRWPEIHEIVGYSTRPVLYVRGETVAWKDLPIYLGCLAYASSTCLTLSYE